MKPQPHLWLALLLTLAGCGHPPADGVRMGLATMPSTLDPRDALIDLAETAETETHRLAAYREIQATAHADLVYAPLWYEGHFAALGPRVRDYRLNRRGDYDALAEIELVAGQ